MKLAHSDYSFQIEFTQGTIPVLSIENPRLWRNIQRELLQQKQGLDGKWVLSDGENEISWKKDTEFIVNPISLDENQKRILNRFFEKFDRMTSDVVHWNQTQLLCQSIQRFLMGFEKEFGFEYSISESIDFIQLAKAAGVQVETEYGTELERLLQYCIMLHDLFSIRLLVFWNLKSYFDAEELDQLYSDFILRHWRVLLIENSERQHLGCEKWYIIDRDYCEIY